MQELKLMKGNIMFIAKRDAYESILIRYAKSWICGNAEMMKCSVNKRLGTVILSCLLAVHVYADNEREQLRNLADIPISERNPVSKEISWPSKVGEAHVCLWKDDKVAAFSITIDDNTKPDHEWWLEQGRKYGFRFTWFCIVNTVENPKYKNMGGVWEDFRKLVDAGHDVQSHTMSHRSIESLEDDYGQAISSIESKLPGVRCLTMAYPGGGKGNDRAMAARYYAGARGTVAVHNTASPDYMNINSVGTPKWSLQEPGAQASWSSIIGIAEKHPKALAKYRGWYCMHFHGVHWLKGAQETIEEPLLKLMDYVKEREALFWVALFREAILYGQERDTAKVNVMEVSDKAIRFTLTDRMADDWYDYPLTIKLMIKDDWKEVKASQNGKPVGVFIVEHEGKHFALIQAVPDKGEVIVQPF